MIYWIWLYLTGKTSLFGYRRYSQHVDSCLDIILKDFSPIEAVVDFDNETRQRWFSIKFLENNTEIECLIDKCGWIGPSFVVNGHIMSGYPSGKILVDLNDLLDQFMYS